MQSSQQCQLVSGDILASYIKEKTGEELQTKCDQTEEAVLDDWEEGGHQIST